MGSNEFKILLSLLGMPAIECLFPRPRQRFVLHGRGGIGKTQPALEFATIHKDHHSAVFWLDGSDIERLQKSFAAVAGQLLASKSEIKVIEMADGSSSMTIATLWNMKKVDMASHPNFPQPIMGMGQRSCHQVGRPTTCICQPASWLLFDSEKFCFQLDQDELVNIANPTVSFTAPVHHEDKHRILYSRLLPPVIKIYHYLLQKRPSDIAWELEVDPATHHDEKLKLDRSPLTDSQMDRPLYRLGLLYHRKGGNEKTRATLKFGMDYQAKTCGNHQIVICFTAGLAVPRFIGDSEEAESFGSRAVDRYSQFFGAYTKWAFGLKDCSSENLLHEWEATSRYRPHGSGFVSL
ncbi:hypothetical protein K432DRAFT_393329 [Lepidopterella palustris CBS 459.81]|uniref:NB-ARC domain-containing protein n=1 Tax=Lepidopterella palustris CBS 459.81 TaxID=1314670 RepID=A0A8E2EAP7_9PEZI|nr:hypothetical protein K432DRAFT_393329 [Lepidopterella palustris CBS 459.81]